MHQLDEKFIEHGGFRTCYVEVGSGAPVLLLHSADAGANAAIEFRENFETLGKHFRVLAPDLLGAGKTTGPKEPPDHATYVRHIVTFLDALNIPHAHLVGKSRGGLISISIAADHPERVDRMILLGNAGGGVSAEYGAQVRARNAEFWGQPPDRERLAGYLKDGYYPGNFDRCVPPDVFEAYWRALLNQYETVRAMSGFPMNVPDLRPTLATLSQPILYMFGREDALWPPLPMALEIFTSTPNARFYVLSHCGHHPQTEHPHDFHALAVPFLQGELR